MYLHVVEGKKFLLAHTFALQMEYNIVLFLIFCNLGLKSRKVLFYLTFSKKEERLKSTGGPTEVVVSFHLLLIAVFFSGIQKHHRNVPKKFFLILKKVWRLQMKLL